jgi:hypothetical protein
MKTSVLIVMSAFLLSATVPVYALTNQELACQLAQVSCQVEAKSFEHGMTIKSDIKNQDQFTCELAQVSCQSETKSLEQKTIGFKSVKSAMKNHEQFVCSLAQVSCPTGG